MGNCQSSSTATPDTLPAPKSEVKTNQGSESLSPAPKPPLPPATVSAASKDNGDTRSNDNIDVKDRKVTDAPSSSGRNRVESKVNIDDEKEILYFGTNSTEKSMGEAPSWPIPLVSSVTKAKEERGIMKIVKTSKFASYQLPENIESMEMQQRLRQLIPAPIPILKGVEPRAVPGRGVPGRPPQVPLSPGVSSNASKESSQVKTDLRSTLRKLNTLTLNINSPSSLGDASSSRTSKKGLSSKGSFLMSAGKSRRAPGFSDIHNSHLLFTESTYDMQTCSVCECPHSKGVFCDSSAHLNNKNNNNNNNNNNKEPPADKAKSTVASEKSRLDTPAPTSTSSSAAESSEDHFICIDCFADHVTDLCKQPDLLRKHDFCVNCPVENCASVPWSSYHVRKLLDGKLLELYLDTLIGICHEHSGDVAGGLKAGSPRARRRSSSSPRAAGTGSSGVQEEEEEEEEEPYLYETLDMLRKQVTDAGMTPMVYLPLEDIQKELQQIFDKLNNEQPYDEARMDFLLQCMEKNPDYLAQKAEEARLWAEEMHQFAAESLRTQRGFTPPHIFDATLKSLLEVDGLVPELAKRLFTKRCLWLVRMSVIDIERVHEVELMGRLNPIAQGLDIVELAAIWAAVPEKFLHDPSGRKAEWRLNLENALKEMDKLRKQNQLLGGKARNACYKKQTLKMKEAPAPFLHRTTLRSMDLVKSGLQE